MSVRGGSARGILPVLPRRVRSLPRRLQRSTAKMIASAMATAALLAPASPSGPDCAVATSLGCFVDSAAARVLPDALKAPPEPASLETCASLVAERVGSAATSHLLLGVEAGKQCWWGAHNGSVGRTAAPASECNLPCAGNHSQSCGGEWRMQLYTATCQPWVPPPPPPPPLRSERSLVFAPFDCDTHGTCYPCFRIPAIKRLKSGKLIAFAEARGGNSKSCGDHGDVRVVARVSSDGSGKNGTWGAIVVVANETGHTIGNPSPVVDVLGSGKIFCHYARDNLDAFVSESDDEGAHWSGPRALDTAIKVPGSGWYGAGVGGGIEIRPNKLMILSEERWNGSYNAIPVSSTDGGRHWQRGAAVSCPSNKAHGLGEPSVAIVPGTDDSHLVMSGRGASGPSFISFSQSLDSGATWSPSFSIAAVTSPGCQAPIAGVRALPAVLTQGGGAGAIITSPSGPGRSHLAAYVASAAANFSDWRLLGRLSDGYAGYSSLLRENGAARDGGGGGDDGGGAESFLVLWEDCDVHVGSKLGMGLWLTHFALG